MVFHFFDGIILSQFPVLFVLLEMVDYLLNIKTIQVINCIRLQTLILLIHQ
jgi:hypothetical protein